MAADRASTDSLCGPLVSSVLAFVARCRRVARGTLFRSRPHDSMALGAAVWSGTGPPSAPPSESNQQVVACGRDLCKSEGPLCYLYRAIDSTGATIDFLLSALRDADAAKQLFRKALSALSHPQPRVINTDLAPTYTSAIPAIKKEGVRRQ